MIASGGARRTTFVAASNRLAAKDKTHRRGGSTQDLITHTKSCEDLDFQKSLKSAKL
jgi:hypothetical protein